MLMSMWSNKSSLSWLVGMQNGIATLAVSFKLNIDLPYNSAITLRGIDLSELKI